MSSASSQVRAPSPLRPLFLQLIPLLQKLHELLVARDDAIEELVAKLQL